MTKDEYLEGIIDKMTIFPRYNYEYLDYINLQYCGERIKRIAYPMICFCDIPLHQLAPHAEGRKDFEGYGKYCIALSKAWGEQKGLQPILYVNEVSELAKQFECSFNAALELANHSQQEDKLSDKMSDGLFELLKYMKPNFGKMEKMKDGKSGSCEKNFHDEKEWRFIPSIKHEDAPNELIDPIDRELLVNENIHHMYSEALSLLPQYSLSFGVDDIKYIFVESDETREKLIDFICKKRTGKLIRKKEKLVLISKIIVYEDIKGDW